MRRAISSAATLALLLGVCAGKAEPAARSAPAAAAAHGQTSSGTPELHSPNPASLAPQTQLPPPAKLQFVADPVSDAAVLSLALGIGGISEAIINTGEITPQRPNSKATFLGIDRNVLEDEPKAAWGSVSNVGLGLAFLFAALDPVETGVRTNPQAGLVDAIIYAETISTTWALTNITKIAVRRPRPSAYGEQKRLDAVCAGRDPTTCNAPSISQTNSALSFFSGHASITASIFATGTYLAFTREPNRARPWIVMALGGVITTLVDIGRINAGKHFPTDVLAGSMAGIGVGILVPHLHRAEPLARRPVWVGFEPYPGGGALTLNALSL